MFESKDTDAFTRTPQTEAVYRSTAQYVIAKAERENGILFDESPTAVIDAIAKMLEGKKRKTVLNYRNAIHWFLESQGHKSGAAYAREVLWSVGGDKADKGPSRQVREVPKDWLDELKRLCRRRLRSPKAMLCYAIIKAGCLVGLRPSEWQSARIEAVGRATHLVVKNGKFSNGRSFGPQRTLILQMSVISEQDREMIEWLLTTASSQTSAQWRETLHDLSNYLMGLRKRHPGLGKVQVSIYSGRHQFAANAKRAGFTLPEIAAMMGHRNTMTATRHYGLRRKGDETASLARFPVRPHPDDVDRVYALQRSPTTREVIPSWLAPD